MSARTNGRKSMLMYVSSMLIFGSIGVFRRFIPLSSEFLAFARGLIGGLFLIAFVKLKNGKVRFHLSSQQFLWLVISGAVIGVNWIMLFEAYTYTTIATTTLCYYASSSGYIFSTSSASVSAMIARPSATAASN